MHVTIDSLNRGYGFKNEQGLDELKTKSFIEDVGRNDWGRVDNRVYGRLVDEVDCPLDDWSMFYCRASTPIEKTLKGI